MARARSWPKSATKLLMRVSPSPEAMSPVVRRRWPSMSPVNAKSPVSASPITKVARPETSEMSVPATLISASERFASIRGASMAPVMSAVKVARRNTAPPSSSGRLRRPLAAPLISPASLMRPVISASRPADSIVPASSAKRPPRTTPVISTCGVGPIRASNPSMSEERLRPSAAASMRSGALVDDWRRLQRALAPPETGARSSRRSRRAEPLRSIAPVRADSVPRAVADPAAPSMRVS